MIRNRSFLASTLVTIAAACGQSNKPSSGSETHLVACDTQADCEVVGSEYTCVEGYCRLGPDAGSGGSGTGGSGTGGSGTGGSGTGGSAGSGVGGSAGVGGADGGPPGCGGSGADGPFCPCHPYPTSMPFSSSAGAPDVEWAERFGSDRPDGAISLALGASGGPLVGGYRRTATTLETSVVSYGPDGVLASSAMAPGGALAHGGGITYVASPILYLGGLEARLARLDAGSDGWDRMLVPGRFTVPDVVGAAADATGVVVGLRSVDSLDTAAHVVVRVGADGGDAWQHDLDYALAGMDLASDGSFVAVGSTSSALVVTRHDAAGDETGRTTVDVQGLVVYGMALAADGRVAVALAGSGTPAIPDAAAGGLTGDWRAVVVFDAALDPVWGRSVAGASAVTFTATGDVVTAGGSWTLTAHAPDGTERWTLEIPSLKDFQFPPQPSRSFLRSGAGKLYFAGEFIGSVDVGVRQLDSAGCADSFLVALGL